MMMKRGTLAGLGLIATVTWAGLAGCLGAPATDEEAGLTAQGASGKDAGPDASHLDAGPDASHLDAGPDASHLDAGKTDAGKTDAGATDAGAPSPYSEAITVLVEPGDKGAALLAAINGATTSIHMTMYLLSAPKIGDALIAQHQAGLEVKVVLNKSFGGTTSSNTAMFNKLQAAGVSVHWAPAQFTYTHEKCVILDGHTAWIMTMNASASAPTANREYLAVDTDPTDVHEAETLFEDDFAGSPPSSSTGKLLVSPLSMRAGLLQLIDGATKTIDVEAEELSDSAIVAALVAAEAAGIKVRVVVASGSLTTAQQAAAATLKQHGVKGVEGSSPYVHAKTIVVDGATTSPRAYVGSANFTAVSLDQNRELGLVTANAVEIAKVSAAFASDFAGGAPF